MVGHLRSDGLPSNFQEDVHAFKTVGISVVFSAGKSGSGGNNIGIPFNYLQSIAIGVVDSNLNAASLSSRGSYACDGTIYPEVTAPGVDIFTADKDRASYFLATGTSVVPPHASVAMPLLKDVYPGETVEYLESGLMVSARDLGYSGPDNVYGYGTLVDCNDNNKATNPVASEIKNDGIDHDGNGYALTIDIIKAVYIAADDKLDVEATSALNQDDDLVLITLRYEMGPEKIQMGHFCVQCRG